MAGNEPHTDWPAEPSSDDVTVLSGDESGVPADMRLAAADVEKRSPLSRPIVALPLFLVLVALGGLMVSSLEKVPVPPTVPEVEDDEGPTAFERRAAAEETLEELGLAATVAYTSVRGISTVDLASGNVTDVRTNSILGPGPYVVLPGNGVSYVLDAATPSRADVLETDAAVVATQTAGRFAIVGSPPVGDQPRDAEAGAPVFASVVDRLVGEELADSQVAVSDELAPDAAYFAAPGLGAVVSRSDGSTAVYDLSGSRELSDHRVVAANVGSRVEIRCSDSCVTFLVGVDAEVSLPAAFNPESLLDPTNGLAVSISPSGKWLLLYNSLAASVDNGRSRARPEGVAAQLFDVESGELLPLAAGQTGLPAWSPDGANVAWLDPTGNDARLIVVGVADRAVTSVDLDGLGAPNRDGDAMVLVPSP